MKYFSNLLTKWVAPVQRAILFLLMLSVTVLVFTQVILRYVLQKPLMGIEELLIFPAIWLYLLGGAQASLDHSHISCGILTLYIKKDRSKVIFDISKNSVSLLIAVWLCRWAYWFFAYSFKTVRTSPILSIPLILGESSIFICLLLMIIYTVAELIEDIQKLKTIK